MTVPTANTGGIKNGMRATPSPPTPAVHRRRRRHRQSSAQKTVKVLSVPDRVRFRRACRHAGVCVCVCLCVRACLRACLRACACVRACVRAIDGMRERERERLEREKERERARARASARLKHGWGAAGRWKCRRIWTKT